jgi:putative peptidoglycan lipid II flippase
MKKTLIFSFKLIFFITLPAMVGLLVLSHPIIQVLFERGVFDTQSTSMSALCLFYFALGIPFISGVKILAPAFYSLKDTKTPAIIAFFVMLIYISCSLILMKPLRVGGIALALSFSVVFNFFILFIILERKIGKIEKKGLLKSVLKSSFSAVIMGGIVWLFMKQVDFSQLVFLKQLGVLLAAIVLGILAYILINLLFNHEDLRSLRDVFSSERILKR